MKQPRPSSARCAATLSALFVALTALAALTACGGSTSPTPTPTPVVVVTPDVMAGLHERMDGLERLIEVVIQKVDRLR